MKFLSSLNPFRKPVPPSATDLALEAIEEHKRRYLSNKADAEYAAKVAAYHEESVTRLSKYVMASTKVQ